MLPPVFTTRSASGRSSHITCSKPSILFEMSYSFPMKYGGEVTNRSTESASKLFRNVKESPAISLAPASPNLESRKNCKLHTLVILKKSLPNIEALLQVKYEDKFSCLQRVGRCLRRIALLKITRFTGHSVKHFPAQTASGFYFR